MSSRSELKENIPPIFLVTLSYTYCGEYGEYFVGIFEGSTLAEEVGKEAVKDYKEHNPHIKNVNYHLRVFTLNEKDFDWRYENVIIY